MICPFRVGAEFEYRAITDKDGNKDYLQTEQRAVYPECYGGECPFYDELFDGTGKCLRIGDDE